ncbi:hypothetical protein BDR26DRAFT_897745 [Obelidium mucronatum]|nr:hypothetical protein BDR26DRAFT_897745 [Obelidium mucronatum]
MIEIPLEVSRLIVQHLPVDKHLKSVGFASNSFGIHVFSSHYSANCHFAQWKNLALNHKIFIALEISATAWNSLPFIYKCAFYNNCFLAGGDHRSWYLNPITRSLGLRLHNHFKVSNPRYSYDYHYVCAATTFGLLEVVQDCATGLSLNPSFDLTDSLPRLIKLALDRNHSDLVRFLINLDCFDPTASGGKVLIYLVEKNQVDFVEKILQDSRTDRTLLNVCMQSLFSAIENGHLAVIQCLMEDPRIRTWEQELNSACCHALNRYYFKWPIAQYFLGLDGFDPSANCGTALAAACSAGHVGLVRTFLQDPRVNPTDCPRCIESAAANGHVDILQILLEDGRADPNKPYNSSSYLYAIYDEFLEVVRLLLMDGRASPSQYGPGLIRMAVEFGDLEILNKLLLDERVNPKAAMSDVVGLWK